MAKKKAAIKAPAVKKVAVKKVAVKKVAVKKVAAPIALGMTAAASGQPALGCCTIVDGANIIRRGGISKPVCDAIGGIWNLGNCPPS